VLHEQQRLDGSIRGALHAVVLKGLLPLTRHWLIPLPASVRSCLEGIVARVETDAFLTLRIRGEKFELARDLAARFPPDLVTLQNLELLAFLEKWDRAGRSGAENWAELRDRMDYICCLFRSLQQDPALFASPFGQAP
jgi:hypothetical protein